MKKILTLLFVLLVSPAAAQVIPSGPWGSINYWGVGGASQVLNPGLAGQCLETQGTGSAPVWVACPGSALNLLPPINTNTFLGNVSGNYQAPTNVDVNTILNTVGYDIARPPPVEAILYKSNVGPTFNWQALPPGTTGSLLTSGGPTNPPFWSINQIQANLSGICTTVGAVLYFDTPSLTWKCLAPGTSGQLLQTGGASGNPSWLTVTLATLGGVPSTRNVNTSSPLSGGGALSSDLTLSCATCVTSSGGGSITGTSPVVVSAAGVVACATCATTTNGGALSATAPIAISAAGVISITSPLPIANGGTNAATQTAAFNNLAPTATRAGDIIYWNGSNYVTLAGNNSGSNVLTENASGVPSWSAPGVGTVTSIAQGAGITLSTAPCTTTCTITNGMTVVKQVFTSSGTYTPTTGMAYAILECQGPGGGAGGMAGAGSNGGYSGSGGAGGYSKVLVTAATVGASQAITIGTGGNGGTAGANNGSAGSGATSVGTLCVANAGSGGGGGTAGSSQGAGGAGGAAGTGDIAVPGSAGQGGLNATVITIAFPTPDGPSAFYGVGGTSRTTNGAGNNAGGFGGGGGPALENNNAVNVAGGNGAPGVVYITEFVKP